MSTYFTDKTFRFLRALARNNERTWFHAHKTGYDAHVREPLQRLVTDLQPDLAEVSLHFRADPRTVGGSLYRIQRDTADQSSNSPTPTAATSAAPVAAASCTAGKTSGAPKRSARMR